MYARIVNVKIKEGKVNDFKKLFEKDVMPVLRKQNGFLDEIALVSPEGLEARGISFWKKLENVDDYNRMVYPTILKNLADMLEGTPDVRVFHVANSTIHKVVEGQTQT